MAGEEMMMSSVVSFLFSRLPFLTTILVWILSTILLFRKWLYRKCSNMPPGPRRWPLIGNLLDVKGKAYTDLFPRWRRRFGPIFTFHLGSRPVTVISDFQGLHEAYINRGNDASSKPVCPSMAVVSNEYRDVTLAPYSDILIVQRKLLEETVRDYVSNGSIAKCVCDVMEETTNQLSKSHGPGNEHRADVSHLIKESMFKIMDRICFGDDISEREITPRMKPVLRNLESLNGNFARFIEDFFPFILKIWPTERFSKHKVDSKVVEDYVYYNFKMTKRNMDHKNPTNLSQRIVAGFHQVDCSFELTDIHLIKMVCNVFYGGVCPTAPTLLWAIYVMCAYPGMQENIYQEVTTVVGDADPRQDHLSMLVYTRAFIQEVWRLFPPLALGVPHATLRSTQLGSYDIPKNSLLLMDYRAIQRDARLFKNPLDFRPERFVSHDGNDVITTMKGYSPFSMGPRRCIGEDLAKELVSFVLISIVQKVKLSFPQGYKADFNKVKDTYYLTPESFPVEANAR